MKLKKLYLEPPTPGIPGRKHKDVPEKSWRVWCDGRCVGIIRKHADKTFSYFTYILFGVTGAPKKGEDVLHTDGRYRAINVGKPRDPIVLKEYESLKDCQKALKDELETHLLSYFENRG
jgi:hypothetical protein